MCCFCSIFALLRGFVLLACVHLFPVFVYKTLSTIRSLEALNVHLPQQVNAFLFVCRTFCLSVPAKFLVFYIYFPPISLSSVYFMNFSYSPYSFGLGKRSENFDYDDDLQLAEQLLNNWETARLVDNNIEMPSDYDGDSLRGSKLFFK